MIHHYGNRSQNKNYAQPESRIITHQDIQISDNINEVNRKANLGRNESQKRFYSLSTIGTVVALLIDLTVG